jgi:tetraacyldisaccharide 4'-kinase
MNGFVFDKPTFETKQEFGPIYFLFDEKKSLLNNKNIVVLTGLARAKNFISMLKSGEYNILHHFKYSDHHNYTEEEIDNICKKCINNSWELIATTEKDAVKLFHYEKIFRDNDISVIVFPLSVSITDDGFSELVLEKINRGCSAT